MLTADARFEGWTATDWSRFLHVWKPRATPDREPTRPRGGVLVMHDGRRVRKLIHTRTGRLDLPAERWPIPLGDLASAHHASWALAAHAGALEEVMERFGARVRRGQDLVEQSLLLVSITREMIEEGAIASWPRRLRNVPTPNESTVWRAVDVLCPAGLTIVLGMFKDGELWTCFVARRRGETKTDGFDVIAGPDDLRGAMGLLSGDWRRDYRHLARAVEDRYGPLSFGCFAEVETFRALQVDARAGAWSRAVLVRDVVVSPMPTAIAIALGVDGARLAFEKGRILIDPFGLLDPVLTSARARLGEGRDVSTTLGFDPMAALRALLTR